MPVTAYANGDRSTHFFLLLSGSKLMMYVGSITQCLAQNEAGLY